jgi:hypothetical protein
MSELSLKQILDQYDSDELEYKMIEEGDWINEHKHQFKTDIIEYNNKYYEIMQNRSGSYWSDYEYGDSEIREVKPVKKVIEVTSWESVNV